MHHAVLQFIEEFERNALEKGLYRKKLGKGEIAFLTQVWGPAFQYNFEGLRAEYPFKDFKGGQRFADFVLIKNGAKIVFEIDGFTTHARNISPEEFEDHLTRQNDLILSGWLILRFSYRQVEKNPLPCQRQIKQAIGHWWSITQGALSVKHNDIWTLRQQSIVQIALRQNGLITPADVASEFSISNRSASLWLKRFATQGILLPSPHVKRVTSYRLAHFTESQSM